MGEIQHKHKTIGQQCSSTRQDLQLHPGGQLPDLGSAPEAPVPGLESRTRPSHPPVITILGHMTQRVEFEYKFNVYV